MTRPRRMSMGCYCLTAGGQTIILRRMGRSGFRIEHRPGAKSPLFKRLRDAARIAMEAASPWPFDVPRLCRPAGLPPISERRTKLTDTKSRLPKKLRTCRVCGCTELNPCVTSAGACRWIEASLCSAPSCAIHARAITDADAPHLGKLSTEHFQALITPGNYEAKAAELKVPVGTIKSRINRARAELAKLREAALEAA